MGVIPFNELQDTARVWIFGSDKLLDDAQCRMLSDKMAIFLNHWTAHKRELKAAWDLRYKRFLFIGLDESLNSASGCSIDNMIHNLKDFERETGLKIVENSSKVFFRNDDKNIQAVNRVEFKELVKSGQVEPDTIVFDNTIQTLADLRQGKWELSMRDSWHGQAFKAIA